VVIVGQDGSLERLSKGIEGRHTFPLLGVDDSGIALRLNKFGKAPLNPVFSPKLHIDKSRWTVSFVPFDSLSPTWVVAEQVIPAILEAFHSGSGVLLLEPLLLDVVPAWTIMSPSEQSKMRETVYTVVRLAARKHFRRFLKWNKDYQRTRNSKGWDVVSNPLDLSSTKRSREFKRLRKLQAAFIEHMRTGKDQEPEQIDFLEDLEPSG
jgi:hypothetical protein